MATTEYNTDTTTNGNQGGLRSELEEPRRTTEGQDFGGYKGVSEEEPPHHKIHTEDEPLPKPAPGTFDEEQAAGDEEAPKSTEGYQEYRDRTEPSTKFDESPVESQPRSYGTEEGTNQAYADPSQAFAGAPVDRKVEEPGYGYDQKTSEPVTVSSPTSETGTPKKEGFMTKIKEKLPGHHAKPADSAVEHDTTAVEHEGAHKKGFMAKIKEKMPGHHSTTGTTATE